MDLRQAARWLTVLPLLALVVTLGAAVGAPHQVLPPLQRYWGAVAPAPLRQLPPAPREGKHLMVVEIEPITEALAAPPQTHPDQPVVTAIVEE